MGNHPHRAYRDERVGNRQYSKRDLEIIQARLRQKKEVKQAKSNSLSRNANTQSMQTMKESKHSFVNLTQNKVRTATPNRVSHATFTASPNASLAKAFDGSSLLSIVNIKQNNQQNRKTTVKEMPSSARDQSGNSFIEAQRRPGHKLTTADPSSFNKPNSLGNSLLNQDNFNSVASSQDFFEQVLEQRDEVKDVNDVTEFDRKLLLETYYRKGSFADKIGGLTSRSGQANNRKNTETESSSDGEHLQTPSTECLSKQNKFAVRMARHMNNRITPSSFEDTNSSSSQRDTLMSKQSALSRMELLDGINFSHVPAMSRDGMSPEDEQYEPFPNQANEDVEEAQVLDKEGDYKLSIMRKKRPLVQTEEEKEEFKEVQQKIEDQELHQKDEIQNKNQQPEDLPDRRRSSADLSVSQGNSKPDDAIRKKLMQKLTINRIMDPTGTSKPKTHQSIFIWDWDDTLMASTFLTPFQSQILKTNVKKKLPKSAIQQLEQLENNVILLLKKSLRYGKTYIITNAGAGWVELSSARFMPKLYKELLMNARSNGIIILSARSLFEKQIPNGFKEWKHRTFLQLSQEMNTEIITNIVAIGDSQIEMDAAATFSEQFKEACLKTVKLKEQPSLVELLRQVELILNQFEEICSCAKNLTIRLQKVDGEEQKKE